PAPAVKPLSQTVMSLASRCAGAAAMPRRPLSRSAAAGDRRHDAIAQAVLWHHRVAFVRVADPGAGYVEPLAVAIAPGRPFTIPIWAAAGALSSTARDMVSLAEAALGHELIGGKR